MNTTIATKKEEVNRQHDDFIDFIREEEKNDYRRAKIISLFQSRIPDIQRSAVEWKVMRQYNKDWMAYIKHMKNFRKLFKKEHKVLCDDDSFKKVGEVDKTKKKRIKETLLWSSQLLGLVGKNGSNYLNASLVKFYQEDLKRQEEFLEGYRLVNAKGKFSKLTSNEKKAKRKNAQNLNLSACLDQMAQDKGFVFSMITLTLPGSYHPSPAKGANTFNGVRPRAAHAQLHRYWRLLRARMAKAGLRAEDSYFGCSTVELHKDSTLHLHCLMYMSQIDQVRIHNMVKAVASESHEYVNFDIKPMDPKRGRSGSTYIFKYIMKTSAAGFEDDCPHLKNAAGRYFYSARAFNFFGVKSAISKFNFIIENKKKYQGYFCDALRVCLDNYDYYTFLRDFEPFFKVVRHETTKAIDFVTFDLNANRTKEMRLNNALRNFLVNDMVIIKRKQFCIFDATENIRVNDIKKIQDLDMSEAENLGVQKAYDKVCAKQKSYNEMLQDYQAALPEFKWLTASYQQEMGDFVHDDEIMKDVFDDDELFADYGFTKKIDQRRLTAADIAHINRRRVTVDLSDSSQQTKKLQKYEKIKNLEEKMAVIERKSGKTLIEKLEEWISPASDVSASMKAKLRIQLDDERARLRLAA